MFLRDASPPPGSWKDITNIKTAFGEVESEGSGKSGIPIHPIRRTKIKRRKNSGKKRENQ